MNTDRIENVFESKKTPRVERTDRDKILPNGYSIRLHNIKVDWEEMGIEPPRLGVYDLGDGEIFCGGRLWIDKDEHLEDIYHENFFTDTTPQNDYTLNDIYEVWGGFDWLDSQFYHRWGLLVEEFEIEVLNQERLNEMLKHPLNIMKYKTHYHTSKTEFENTVMRSFLDK